MPPQNQPPYQPQPAYQPPMPPGMPMSAPMPAAVVTETRAQPFQDFAAGFFIASVSLLSIVSILGVWQVFGSDVIMKSFETLGLLAIVSIAIIVAGRYLDKGDASMPSSGAPVFKSVRQITLGVLIVSAALFALLGVLAIWEVITDHETVYRSLSSLAIVAFASLISVAVCLERENNNMARKNVGGLVVVLIIVGWLFLSLMHF